MTLRPSPRELCRAWTSDEQEFAKGYIRARSLIRESGCWEWTRYIDYAGYGKGAIFSSTPLGAHRIAFAAWGGVLDSALTLDHLCRNRKCVNPAHLEQISHRENTLRGENVGAINFRKTTCKKGHPFDRIIKHPDGSIERRCQRCYQEISAFIYQRKKKAG